MKTIDKKNEEKLFTVSENAMFASAISGLIGFFEDDDKTPWKEITKFRLEVFMPEDTPEAPNFPKLLVIVIIAQVVGIEEVELKVLQKIRKCLPDDVFQETFGRVNYGNFELTHETKKFIIKQVVMWAFHAGWRDAESSFAELDAVMEELGVEDMNLREVLK